MEQMVDVKTLVVVFGLAQPVIIITVILAVMKYLVGDHHKTLYGNGKPGLVKDIVDIRSDVRSLTEHLEILGDTKEAAKVVAGAVVTAAKVIADEARRVASFRENIVP